MILPIGILSGKQAGTTWVARRFPVRIGRDSSNDLQLDEDGVWNEHAIIELDPREGFLVQACAQAIVSLNGNPVDRCLLRNGDVLEMGAVQLRFWLAETSQTGLLIQEGLVWTGIGAICLGQIALIYWLLSG